VNPERIFTFVRGDVTRLGEAGVAGPFELLLDCGCFHAMEDDRRRRYVESITRVAAENVQLLLFALGPPRRPLNPCGAQRVDLEHHFSIGWSIVWSASEEDLPYALTPGVTATWYVLKRNEPPPRRAPEQYSRRGRGAWFLSRGAAGAPCLFFSGAPGARRDMLARAHIGVIHSVVFGDRAALPEPAQLCQAVLRCISGDKMPPMEMPATQSGTYSEFASAS
jgi:hypothetical protein